MKPQFKIKNTGSYKIGMNEIEGLKSAIREVLAPIQKSLQSRVYWDELDLETVEYLRRDGFIPHSHNCGGLELSFQVPEYESSDFSFLEFGQHDCEYSGCDNVECNYENDGELDAFLRIRLKFEGIQDDNSLKFYLFMEGGNNDAPYFRDVPTLFETEFSCKSVEGLKKASSKAIKQLLKLIK